MRHSDAEVNIGCGIIVLTAIVIFVLVMLPIFMGVGYWRPEKTQVITVQRLYVDVSSGKDGSSHYMVGTDYGVFEVSNSWLLGIWNADELYSRMMVNKRYRITTCGNKITNWFMQEYPYIVSVESIDDPLMFEPE